MLAPPFVNRLNKPSERVFEEVCLIMCLRGLQPLQGSRFPCQDRVHRQRLAVPVASSRASLD